MAFSDTQASFQTCFTSSMCVGNPRHRKVVGALAGCVETLALPYYTGPSKAPAEAVHVARTFAEGRRRIRIQSRVIRVYDAQWTVRFRLNQTERHALDAIVWLLRSIESQHYFNAVVQALQETYLAVHYVIDPEEETLARIRRREEMREAATRIIWEIFTEHMGD